MEDCEMEKLGLDMDGIRIDSARPTETDSSISERDERDTSEDDNTPYELRLTSNKGYGLFATQHIPRGTCIVEEPALVSISADVARNGPERAIAIIQSIDKLSPDQLDAYNGLFHNPKSVDPAMRAATRVYLRRKQYSGNALEAAVNGHIEMLAIFNTNAVSMGEDGKLGSGVFINFSRCNHSCTPNVENCFNTVTGCEMLHAVREIMEGEEITVSYIDKLYRPAEVRGAALRRWAFECDCEACEGRGALKSAQRRRRMAEIHRAIDVSHKSARVPPSSSKSAIAKLQKAEELVKLCYEEGLVGMELGYAYHLCSQYALESGQLIAAMQFARDEVEVEQTCVGTVMQLENSAASWLEQLEQLAMTHDRRFRAEKERMQKRNERVVKKAERKMSRQVEKEEVARKREEAERAEALKVAEEGEARREKEAAEKTAKDGEKKSKEAVKTAAKKARRAIRECTKKAEMSAETVDAAITAISGEDVVALAARLQTASDVEEVKRLLVANLNY